MGFGHKSSKSTTGPAFEKQRSEYGGTLFKQGQGIFGETNPTLRGMLNNPITPGERSAIFESAMQPVASAFDAAGENAARRAARTRNPAGLLEADEQLAREKGQGLSTAANRAELAALNIQDQRRKTALAALGQMYGISEEAMARLLSGQQGSSKESGFSFTLPTPSGF